jgi:hypothetical protein
MISTQSLRIVLGARVLLLPQYFFIWLAGIDCNTSAMAGYQML